MNSHTCPALGCTASLPRAKLLCGRHWRLVPRELQQQVNGLWRQCLAGHAEWEDYFAARGSAIDAVNAQLAPKAVQS